MTDKDTGEKAVQGRPSASENDLAGAAKTPAGAARRVRSSAREERLAEALRANLRRRKAGNQKPET